MSFWLPVRITRQVRVAAMLPLPPSGVYAILRASSLLEDPHALGGVWLYYLALATMVYGIVGMLASRQLPRLVASSHSRQHHSRAVGSGIPSMIAPALFYMLGSVFATARSPAHRTAERLRAAPARLEEVAATPPPSYNAFAVGEPPDPYSPDDEVGAAFPAATAFLGLAFVCCALLVTGLPPLAGFIAKFALVAAAIDALPVQGGFGREWLLIIAFLGGGLAGLIALMRVGMRLFWSAAGRQTPRLWVSEAAPIAFLILICVALTVAAGPAMTYLDSAAVALDRPDVYIRNVLGLQTP